MATATATAAAAASPSTSSSLLPRRPLPPNSTAARCLAPPGCRARLRTARQVAVSSVSPSPSPGVADEEAAAAPKLGKRVRVTAPVLVYHVPKAPDLDLRGMEGVIKQYVGVWKGKRITANRPFRVEFELKLDGQDKPVRFLAHLREDEFEFVGDE